MRCLYCGKRLALLRKLTDSEFCSDPHRRLYQQEQEKMALARLMDAQKRFSAFSANGPVNGAAVNGVSKAVEAAATGEMSRKFLNDMPPAVVGVANLRPVVPLPLGQLPDLFVPEFTAMRACEPPAGLPVAMETQQSARALDFPMRWVGAEIESSVLRPGMPAFAAPALAASVAPLQPSVSLDELFASAPLTMQALRFEMPVVAEIAGTRVLPVRVDSRPTAMEMAGKVEVVCEPKASLLQRLHTPIAAAPFPGALSAAALKHELRPIEDGPAVVLEEAQAPEFDPDAPCPPLRKLYALPKPELRHSEPRMRRARARELFFPVLKSGYLQALASKAAKRMDGPAALSGTESAQWRPGRMVYDFRPGFTDDGHGRGVQAFPFLYTEPSKMASVPQFGPVAWTQTELSVAQRIEGEVSLYARDSAIAAALTCEVEESAFELNAIAPVPPRHAVGGFEEPSLIWMMGLQAIEEAQPCRLPSTLRSSVPEPIAPSHQLHISMPLSGCDIQSGARLEIGSVDRMAAIEPSAERAGGQGMMKGELSFEVEVRKAEATLPGSRIPGGFAPARPTTVFPLLPGEGSPYPKNTVAIQELITLWPEPVALTPKMPQGIAEDSQVRNAVQAMSAILEQERRRGFLSRLPLPSLPVTRADLKWFVMSIPVVLLLAVYSLTNSPSNPRVAASRLPAEVEVPASGEPADATLREPEAAASTSGVQAGAPVKPTVPVVNTTAEKPGFMDGLRQGIMQRAAVSLSDDFRSGLGEWEGRGDWSKSWSYDAAGFVHTGPLALYRPSLALSDYSMEFLGQIEKKSMGWVYRAANLDNYYASKIILIKNGPMPSAVIERYAVINGKVSSLARRPMPIQVRSDMLYRVRMDVRGDGFTLTVQGQVVDYWSDNRLKTGGIGFFSAKGEQSSLRWVEISHQYDFLGRLCAFLAPYSLPTKDGSAKQ